MLFGHTSLCNRIMSFLLTELPSLCMLLCRCDMSSMLLRQYLLEEVIKMTWLLVDPQAGPSNRRLFRLFTTLLPTIPMLLLFSHSVVSNSLWSHGLHHARHSCPSPSPKFVQTHVHLVGDAIQPSHSLLCPSLPAFNLFQHQSLFQWVGSSHQVQFSSVQLLSHVRLLATSLSITNSWNLPKLKSIELVMPSNHLIFCHPLLILPSIFPIMRVLSNESALCIRWLQYWSFSISPSNEYSGLISFRTDWFDLLAVQGTLKSLIQHHSSKHQFFGTQLSLWSSSHICTWLLEKP